MSEKHCIKKQFLVSLIAEREGSESIMRAYTKINSNIFFVIVLFFFMLHSLFSCDDCKKGEADTPTATPIPTLTPTPGEPEMFGAELFPLQVGNRWVFDYYKFWSFSSPDYSNYDEKQGTVTVEVTEYGYFYEKNAFKINITSHNAIGNSTVYMANEDGSILLRSSLQFAQYRLFLPQKVYFGPLYNLILMFHLIEKESDFQDEIVITVPAGEYNVVETTCKENIFDPDSVFGGDRTYKQDFVRKLGLLRSRYEENFYHYNAETASHTNETFSLVTTMIGPELTVSEFQSSPLKKN